MSFGERTPRIDFLCAPIQRAAIEAPTWNWPLSFAGFRYNFLISPLARILREIRSALEVELWLSALNLTLVLPDICSALRDPKGLSSGPKYAAWYDEAMGRYAGWLPGAECYKLRCGVLHQGRSGRGDMEFKRIAFGLENGVHLIKFGGFSMNGREHPSIQVIDLRIFSQDMMSAAVDWFNANCEDVHVKRNMLDVIRFYPDGPLSPFVGMGAALA